MKYRRIYKNHRDHPGLGFKGKVEFSQTWLDKFSDSMTQSFGTTIFFLLNLIIFLIWFFINSKYSGVPAFDPYPYELLTMSVSLEAIFLSIIVLMSQNRENRIAEERAELDFEINVRAEQEVTKIITMIQELGAHQGLTFKDDEDMKWMKIKTDVAQLKNDLEKEMGM